MIFAFANKFGNYAGMKTQKFQTGFDKYLILAESDNELNIDCQLDIKTFQKPPNAQIRCNTSGFKTDRNLQYSRYRKQGYC